MKLSDIKPNPDNPRIIKDESFEKLCNSIKEFPKMMKLRPIVVDMQKLDPTLIIKRNGEVYHGTQ